MRLAVLSLLLVVGCTPAPSPDGRPSSDEACPKDELPARGASCASEGKTCGTSAAGFTHFLMCSRGKWVEMEAPPPPPQPTLLPPTPPTPPPTPPPT